MVSGLVLFSSDSSLSYQPLFLSPSPPLHSPNLFKSTEKKDYNHDEHLDAHELKFAFTEHDATHSVSLKDVEEMVDHVLAEDDLDNDGTISWEEYLASEEQHHEL